MEEVNKNTELNDTDKKLHISGVINSILPEILEELYQMGFDDGYNTCANVELSMGGEPWGYDKVLEYIYKKYCL
jgi:hypothetical protein